MTHLARNIPWLDQDQAIYRNEIQPWLPERIFDAHAHLLEPAYHPRLRETMPLSADPMLSPVDLPYLETWWRVLFPDASTHGLIMGFPTEDVDVRAENEWAAAAATTAQHPFSLMLHPAQSPASLDADILRLKPVGLKPYMVFVDRPDPGQASLTDMMPEPLLEVANRHGLAITLHVAKPRGMADPGNLHDLDRLAQTYPRVQFILAHCGRCFITPNMIATLDALTPRENIWFDTSAVCDPGVFVALLQRYDRNRILFGTDLVSATASRGSYIRLGLTWHLCTAEMVARQGGLLPQATYAVCESTAALCNAMRLCAVSDQQRTAIFHDNAVTLFSGIRAS